MYFKKITEYLDSLEAEGIPSVDCIIYKNHEQVYRHFKGFSDSANTKKMQGNELYLMFSCTKLITMTAALQLVEKNLLDLYKPVSDYLPAYKNLKVKTGGQVVPAQKTMLVQHLLSMRSGLDYNLNRAGIIRVLNEKETKSNYLSL